MVTNPLGEPPMVSIDRRIYEVSDEPANVMSPQFDQIARVMLSNNESALLYQCARTGRLAVAPANIRPDRPLAVYIVLPKVTH